MYTKNDESLGVLHHICEFREYEILIMFKFKFAFLTEVPEFLGRYNVRVEFRDRGVCLRYYASWVTDVIGVHLFNSFIYWFRVILVHFLPCVLLLVSIILLNCFYTFTE